MVPTLLLLAAAAAAAAMEEATEEGTFDTLTFIPPTADPGRGGGVGLLLILLPGPPGGKPLPCGVDGG